MRRPSIATPDRSDLTATGTPPPVDREDTSMTSTLSGRTALVTGSSRGIGRAIALGLAREGALAAVHYGRDEQAAEQTVDLIEKEGGRAFAVGAELGTPGAVDQLFCQLEAGLRDHTGEAVLDILVNNAAATTPAGSTPEQVPAEQIDEIFGVNAKAPFFLATDRARWITGAALDATGGSLLGAQPAPPRPRSSPLPEGAHR